MHLEREIADGIFWIGGDDLRLELFEGLHPGPGGVSYNTYVITDEKTCLLDTIDRAVEERFFSSLEHVLADRALDYIVVQHVEPDHSASLATVCAMHPEAKIVCSAMAKKMIGQFFGEKIEERCEVVGEGDTLELGRRVLTFVAAPMVHWPEVLVTYSATDKLLFSADAFGTFGALGGRLDLGDWDFEHEWLPEARRYYANIVGKYGDQVTTLLGKAAGLDIETICPLHGPILHTDDIPKVLEKYTAWASYAPEEPSVAIAFASVYGGTRDVAEALAFKLTELGVKGVTVTDLSAEDTSYAIGEFFRASNIVLASTTYNMGLFPKMHTLLNVMTELGMRDRRYALIENGTWAPTAGKLMKAELDGLAGFEQVGETLTVKSRLADEQDAELDALAGEVAGAVR